MSEDELDQALTEMMFHATEIVGFRDLLEAEGVDRTELDRVKWEAHIAAAGHALAIKTYKLRERLREEGLRKW